MVRRNVKIETKQGGELLDEASGGGKPNEERLSRQWTLDDTTCYNIETKIRMGGVWKGVLAMMKALDTQKHSSLSEQGGMLYVTDEQRLPSLFCQLSLPSHWRAHVAVPAPLISPDRPMPVPSVPPEPSWPMHRPHTCRRQLTDSHDKLVCLQ